MRPVVVVVLAPVVDDAAHVAQAREPVLRQAFVAKAAVEALDVGVLHLCTGLPGWMKRSSTPFLAQVCIVLPGELRAVVGAKVGITLGSPRSALTWSSTRVTFSAGIEVSAAICTASLLQSSTTVSVLTRRPLDSSSNTKSMLHTSSGCIGRTKGCLPASRASDTFMPLNDAGDCGGGATSARASIIGVFGGAERSSASRTQRRSRLALRPRDSATAAIECGPQ